MADDSDKPACAHARVDKAINEDLWACQGCGTQFFPAYAVPNAEVMDTALDAIAGTMSAVLWDFHERAVAKYGADVMPDMPEDCDHEFNSGQPRCTKCGYNPYLGAE